MASDIQYTEIEKDNVINVYNTIASKFSKTRYKPWQTTLDFINSLEPNINVLEVGCGNGKNMNLRDDINFYGCDNSSSLLDICREKQFNVKECDGCYLDYKVDEFDAVYSIAVLHHLSTWKRRIKFISEMVRVSKNKSKIMIQVWAVQEPKYEKSELCNLEYDHEKDILYSKHDKFVKFRYADKDHQRYYHFFTKEELEELINDYNKEQTFGKIEGNVFFSKNNYIFEGVIN
jgi:ubiquinone/menaquinone biosynthesis C-methylase UbiE